MTRTRWWLAGIAALALLAACGGSAAEKKSGPTGGSTGSASLAQATSATEAPQAADQARPGGATATSADARAAPASTGQAGQPQAGQPLPDVERKIIYNVTLDLSVDDLQGAFQTVSSIALNNGGYIADSDVRRAAMDPKDHRATITIRVPVDRFNDVMNQIRGLGKVEAERSSANDVTEEYTDLQSRVRTLEATETKLLEFLGQARSIQDTLTVQDRINAVRTEIDRARGRMNLLTKLSDLATIRVQLKPVASAVTEDPKPKPKENGGPLAALRTGWEASTELLGGVTTVLLTAVAFSWWLLPFIALGVWLVRRERRNRLAATRHVPPAGDGTP